LLIFIILANKLAYYGGLPIIAFNISASYFLRHRARQADKSGGMGCMRLPKAKRHCFGKVIPPPLLLPVFDSNQKA